MYCSKCGKEIDYESPVCLECTAIMAMQSREGKKQNDLNLPTVNPVSAPTEPMNEVEAPKKSRGKRTAGLVKAILANVLPFTGYYILIFSIAFSSLGGDSFGFSVLALLATCVVGFIFAIQSIKTFKRARKLGDPAPIPALILGINALVMVSIFVLYGLLIAFIFSLTGLIELDYNIFDYSYFYS